MGQFGMGRPVRRAENRRFITPATPQRVWAAIQQARPARAAE